jgi:hypothetical protein
VQNVPIETIVGMLKKIKTYGLADYVDALSAKRYLAQQAQMLARINVGNNKQK